MTPLVRVFVYTHPREEGRLPLILTYTQYQGADACVHVVRASTGYDAKKIAAREHKDTCLQLGAPRS